MENNNLYKDYSSYLKEIFNFKVQKISINAGFSCPNRDGKISTGGCTYCNNQTFSPEYCLSSKTISEQIIEGKRFFEKYKGQKYLAYFQSFTNTYADFEILKKRYEEALSDPDVVGIVIGTRPDCVDSKLLDYLKKVSETYYVMLEYGVESTKDETLKLINRGHTYQVAENAIKETAKRGLNTCAHLILGLPCEDKNDIMLHAKRLSELPLVSVKLHQLQIIKGTRMASQIIENPEWFNLFSADEYIDLAIDFVERLNPNFVVERFVSQSPKELRISPNWGIKNYEFVAKLEKRMLERKTYQGRLSDQAL